MLGAIFWKWYHNLPCTHPIPFPPSSWLVALKVTLVKFIHILWVMICWYPMIYLNIWIYICKNIWVYRLSELFPLSSSSLDLSSLERSCTVEDLVVLTKIWEYIFEFVFVWWWQWKDLIMNIIIIEPGATCLLQEGPDFLDGALLGSCFRPINQNSSKSRFWHYLPLAARMLFERVTVTYKRSTCWSRNLQILGNWSK